MAARSYGSCGIWSARIVVWDAGGMNRLALWDWGVVGVRVRMCGGS